MLLSVSIRISMVAVAMAPLVAPSRFVFLIPAPMPPFSVVVVVVVMSATMRSVVVTMSALVVLLFFLVARLARSQLLFEVLETGGHGEGEVWKSCWLRDLRFIYRDDWRAMTKVKQVPAESSAFTCADF